MSDKMANRVFLGNLQSPWEESERLYPHRGKRRLVEECEAVSVYAVQRAFGKKVLIAAIRQARPFRLPVPGGYSDVWLVYEIHRLPGKAERWSSLEDGTARLWLQCPGCLRRVGKLYYFHLPGSLDRSRLLCRGCHRLTYQSVNCGGNRWYREVARPLKRLLRAKHKLTAMQQTPRIAARLARVQSEIEGLRQKLKPKTHQSRRQLSCMPAFWQRRPYRDLALLE